MIRKIVGISSRPAAANWQTSNAGPAARATRDANFAALYRNERAFVLHVLRQAGLPAQDLDDAAQEVFIVTHRRLDALPTNGALKAWLRAVAQHVCQNCLRSQRRRMRHRDLVFDLETLPDERTLEPDTHFERRQAQIQLARIIESLDAEKREVFVLSELEELPKRTIGVEVRVPHGTAMARLRAARGEVNRKIQITRKSGFRERSTLAERSAAAVILRLAE